MTDREKLIDLMVNAKREDPELLPFSELLADYLIANGVTFAPDTNVGLKWIPVAERLPDLIPCNAGTAYSEAVIIWTSGRKAMIGVWDGTDFLCAADYWEADGEEITHWMPLPEAPKEE